MNWSSERISTLTRLWIEGRSSGEIAKILGGVTRNAVMGKINRLGLIGNSRHNASIKAPIRGCCRPKPVEEETEILLDIEEEIDPNVILVAQGTMASVWSASLGMAKVDHHTVFQYVEKLTGHVYAPDNPGHKAALIAIATILSRGNPRRILLGVMSEQSILPMMRKLAEKGFVVGGVTPEKWRDPENGDVLFYEDMLLAEELKEKKTVKLKPKEPQTSILSIFPSKKDIDISSRGSEFMFAMDQAAQIQPGAVG